MKTQKRFPGTKTSIGRPPPPAKRPPFVLIGAIIAATFVIAGGVATYVVFFSGDPDENEIKRLIHFLR